MTATPHPFEYHEALPPSDLAAVVHSFWLFRATDAAPERYEHTVWPDACVSVGGVQLRNTPPMFITVPARVEAFITTVYRDSVVCGVRFWPDTGKQVTSALPSRATQQLPQLVAAAREPHALWKALVEWSRAFIVLRETPDPIVRRAIHLIVERGGDIDTRVIATEVGLGSRQLQRRFARATGLTIKSYARVRRIRTVLSLWLGDNELTWSKAAAEAGFADHAHLSREFATLTGLAPRSAAAHLSRIHHRDVTP